MEIKSVLDENNQDMISFFRKNKIKYRKYSLEKCYIMKSDDVKEDWHRYLRGLVYNYEENNVFYEFHKSLKYFVIFELVGFVVEK